MSHIRLHLKVITQLRIRLTLHVRIHTKENSTNTCKALTLNVNPGYFVDEFLIFSSRFLSSSRFGADAGSAAAVASPSPPKPPRLGLRIKYHKISNM